MTSRHRNFDNSDRDGKHCECHLKRKANASKYGATSVLVKSGNESGRTFRVDRDHDLKITEGNSEITVSTAKTHGSVKPTGCSNPSDCPRMRSMNPNLMMSKMTEEDRVRLEEAIKEACDSVTQLRTFDEVEELVEIQNCTDIQRKLANLINEKRKKLERNRARREAELFERQQDFHKRVMDRVKMDNQEMVETHQRLFQTLSGQGRRPSSSSSREELVISHSQTFGNFNPQAESTRLDTNIKYKMPRQPRP